MFRQIDESEIKWASDKRDEGASWKTIAEDMGVSVDRIRGLVRRRRDSQEDSAVPNMVKSVTSEQILADGSVVSEKLIEIRNETDKTPYKMMKLHGFDPLKWVVTACRNNYWDSQKKGGEILTLYQSRLVVKPLENGITEQDLRETIDRLCNEYPKKTYCFPTDTIVVKKPKEKLLALVDIADLHLGKLCWHGETPENYDSKIGKRVWGQLLKEIFAELAEKQGSIEEVLFVWSNDFYNADNQNNTTTAGTPQDMDVRIKKMLNMGCDMLADAIDMLSSIAPVRTFYTKSNHDEILSYATLRVIYERYKTANNVTVDLDAYPRKYIEYGSTLLGFTHGKEKNKNLAGLMPNEASEAWGRTKYREMICHHLHSEQSREEISGVLIDRMPSPTAQDVWHVDSGYIGAVRKVKTMLYDKQYGRKYTINTVVKPLDE